MLRKKIRDTASLILFLLAVTSCGEKPSVTITATKGAPDEVAAKAAEGGAIPIQASMSDADWEKIQTMFTQTLLPRIEAIEGAILWLPTGSNIISAQTDVIVANTSMVVEQTAVVIHTSTSLLEKTEDLLEKTSILVEEAKKTRAVLEMLVPPLSARK